MREPERIAKAIVEHVLIGAVMRFEPQQAHGEPDFSLTLPDGRTAVLEVTELTEPDIREWNSLRSKRPSIRAQHCTRTWWIDVSGPEWSLNRIYAESDRLLAAIEAEGLTEFSAPTDARTSPAVRNIFRIGVSYGSAYDTAVPEIHVRHLMQPVARNADALVAAVEREASRSDNRKKLREPGVTERHFFMWVGPDVPRLRAGLLECVLPADAPRLPPEVTHVWIAAPTYSARGAYVVWRGTAHGWTDAQVVSIKGHDPL